MSIETEMTMNVEGRAPFLTLNAWEKRQQGLLIIVAKSSTGNDGEIQANFDLIIQGELVSVRDIAIRESRKRGIVYTQINRTLLDEVLNTKAVNAEFDIIP